MTQKQRLLKYLKKHKTIDPLESWKKLGIYRLSSVIHLLKRDGFYIITNRKVIKNRYDEECKVALYKIEKVKCDSCGEKVYKARKSWKLIPRKGYKKGKPKRLTKCVKCKD